MFRAWLFSGAWYLVLGALLLGCVTEKSAPTSTPSGPITQLTLLAAPVALNLDGLPGADSLVVKIYASTAASPKPVPITSGTLELLAFEGLLKKSTNAPEPFKTWTFTASELRRRQFKASIGTGYEITASWPGLKPKADKLTILVRYQPSTGRPLYSSASTISVTAN